jgi:hypothetical protein
LQLVYLPVQLRLHRSRRSRSGLVGLLLLALALRNVRPVSQPLRPLTILPQLPDQLPLLALLRHGDARPPVPLTLQLGPQRLLPRHQSLRPLQQQRQDIPASV